MSTDSKKAIAQKPIAALQRKLTGVLSNFAAGCIDKEALNGSALPLFTPPRKVVLDNVLLRRIDLCPAITARIPGRRGSL